jgi:hypothetical protein
MQIGCPDIIPHLRARPFWDTAQFEWVIEVERSYDFILREFLEMKRKDGLFQVVRENELLVFPPLHLHLCTNPP